MKKVILTSLSVFFAFIGGNNIYSQCTAVTTNVPATNGREYSNLPACNSSVTDMEAPPTGYLVMSGLQTGGVYTVSRTGGNVSNYLTARSTPTAGTVFGHGTGPLTFQVTTGTVANIVVTGANAPGCFTGTTWNGTSTVLQYRREQPNIPNTPTISYNCAASQTTLTSGGGAVSGITPAYQWQGSNNNSTWTNIASATSTTYTITTATSPQYNYYRMVASYGSCTRPSASVSVIPQGTFSGNIVITQNTTIGGIFNITGDFTVNAGVTITVPQGCEFFVEANNVTINGTIDATASGNLGGSAGARGTSGNNLGCRSNANADAAGGIRGGNGVGPGRGLQPSANGGTGVGCGQDCKFDADYAGMVIGGGGAGAGGGGSYGGVGGNGGFGGISGWFSYNNVVMNHNFIDVCTNRESTTMAASGLGSAGGGSNGVYGTPTGFADIDFGSGGAGAAGGGRGADLGGTAIGSGGNGGGKITIISRQSGGAPYTFTLTGAVRANGGNGGAGGTGGNSGRTANNCCSDICDQRDTEEATNVTGGGGGGGGGAGSGGGVLLIAYGNSSIGGNIQAIGGNGGAGGGGGASSTSTYGAGFPCGSPQTINNFAGDAGGAGGAGGGGRIKIFVSECGTHTASYSHSVAAGTGSGAPAAGSHHYGFIPGTELIAGSISSAQTICEGQTPSSNLTTTLPTGGVGNFEYQWYRSNTCATATTGSSSTPASGWTAIGGATGTTLTPAQIGALSANTCFQLRYQSGTCFRWSNSIQITVNPAATANAGSATTICSGSAYALAGSSVGGSATTGAWSIVSTTGSLTTNSSQLSSISQTSNPSAVTFTPVLGAFGTATLRLTTNDPDGAGPCSPATSQVVITVNQNATANAGSPATICSGSAYALAGSSVGGSATTGAWSIISATGSLTTNSSQLSSTAQSANPSTVTFTPTLGTFGTATLRLTTNDPAGPCNAVTSDVVITVNQNATANSGSAATICSGSTYTLTGSSVGGSATTGAWSIVSTTGTLTTNTSQLSSTAQTGTPSSVTFTPTLGTFGTATLRLTTNTPAGPCNAVTSDVVITVNQNATANAGSAATICSGSTYTLTGSSVGGSATTGAWSIVSTTGSLTTNAAQLSSTAQTSNPSAVTYTPTLGTFGTATLRLTTNTPAGPCNAVTSDVVITVNQNATANAGSSNTICTGTTYTLAGSSVGGSATTGAWSIVSTTGTLTTNASQLSSTAQTANPSTVTFTPTLGTSGTVTLRLTSNDPDGAGPCTPATSDVLITVDQNPTTSNAGANFSICNSTTATLAGNTPVVGTGTWTVVSGTANITSPNSPTSGLTGLVPGTPSSSVTLRWTIANGTCTSSFSDVTITNFAASNGSLAVSVPSTICEGQTANIGLLTGTVGSQFQWQSSPDGSTWSNISGATSSSYTTLSLNTTTTDNWFRASVTNGTCPAAFSLPVLVNVDPAIANNTIASNQSVCLGSAPSTIIGTLPTGGNGSYAYAWQISTTSASGPWSFIPAETGQNYSPGPISQQTWFRRRVTSSLCQEFSNVVQIDILTGNSNVYLVSGDTRTALEECVDGDWTYYSTALNPNQFIFAIRKYTNNFTATVTIVDEPGTTTYSSIGGVGPARGTFLAGRTYDVNITSGSVTAPVDIRFFIDVSELAQALAEAQALLAVTPIPGSTITPLTFFKAPTTFNPSTMMNSGNFTFTPSNTWTYGPANPVSVAPPDGFINGVAYYELTGLTSFSGGTGGYSVNDGAPALLPVELISFTATAVENRYIRLDWTTATEINNELFEVERSLDGINFEKIGEVQGNGNSTQIISYSFNDMEPSVGVNYYRLKQIDFDGTFEYSNIVNARISVRDNFEVSNFIPNPAEGSTTLRFSSLKKQTVQIQIYNIMGQIVESKSVELLPGVQTIHFDTQLYADGTYTAVIKANNDVHTRKLIISK